MAWCTFVIVARRDGDHEIVGTREDREDATENWSTYIQPTKFKQEWRKSTNLNCWWKSVQYSKISKKKTVERSAVLFLFQSNILKSNGFEKVLITIIKPRKTFRFYNGTWNQFKIDWASLCYLALPCKHSMKSCFHLSITSRWSIKMLSIS